MTQELLIDGHEITTRRLGKRNVRGIRYAHAQLGEFDGSLARSGEFVRSCL